MANEAMQAAWDGEEGEHWAEFADRYDAASVRPERAFLAAIPIAAADAVLDIGCGAGGLALSIAAEHPAASVLGVDLSSQMLDVAGKRAAARGLTNVAFEQADAQTHAFVESAYDVAVSSFGVMFFDDPVAAFSNIGRALKPGGQVRFAAWRALQDNPWLMSIRGALAMGRDLPFPPLEAPTPFSLSNPERTTSLLSAAGFVDIDLTPLDEPMIPGSDADDAYSFISQIGIVKGLSHDLDDAQRVQALANLRQMLAEHETPDGVLVDTAAWIISARKP
jgi:SAM-dependent methyltransferase